MTTQLGQMAKGPQMLQMLLPLTVSSIKRFHRSDWLNACRHTSVTVASMSPLSAQTAAAVHRKACSKYSSTVNCNLTQHQAIELLKLDDTSQHAHLHYRH